MPSINEDRSEILQLMYRYNHLYNAGEAEAWANLFTPDGEEQVVDGPTVSGRESLASHCVESGKYRNTVEHHVVTNPAIDVTGDTATTQATLLLFRGVELALIGTYDDKLARTAEGWRFARRTFRTDALSDDFQASMAAFAAEHPELFQPDAED
jgi:hypothetical protein